jgi:DNA-binding winged helix-turn-helix (wHTH) protein
VVELLALLIENCGRMVSRDEIIDRIWHGRIVSEAAVSSRIKSARQALDDDGQTQRYIRTIHKKGFRFVGEVERGGTAAEAGRDAGEAAGSRPAATTSPTGIADGGAAAHAARPAVAVLPLINLSPDADQEYLADGITGDLIARLAKHRWMDVVARNTCFGYKGRAVDARRVGAELKVDYVVEGSM